VAGLQAAGLVETYQGRGSFVTALPKGAEFNVGPAQVRSHRDVVALMEFRLGVEVEGAGLAADRRTDHQLRSIERALGEYKRSSAEPSRAVDADFRFHDAVAVASGNRFYVDLIGSLGPMMIMLPRTRLKQEYTVADRAIRSGRRSRRDAPAPRQHPAPAEAGQRGVTPIRVDV
jgi:GntR family transcriptional regulator, transcriptional repressor for pyruvate dehydrogenase complex